MMNPSSNGPERRARTARRFAAPAAQPALQQRLPLRLRVTLPFQIRCHAGASERELWIEVHGDFVRWRLPAPLAEARAGSRLLARRLVDLAPPGLSDLPLRDSGFCHLLPERDDDRLASVRLGQGLERGSFCLRLQAVRAHGEFHFTRLVLEDALHADEWWMLERLGGEARVGCNP